MPAVERTWQSRNTFNGTSSNVPTSPADYESQRAAAIERASANYESQRAAAIERASANYSTKTTNAKERALTTVVRQNRTGVVGAVKNLAGELVDELKPSVVLPRMREGNSNPITNFTGNLGNAMVEAAGTSLIATPVAVAGGALNLISKGVGKVLGIIPGLNSLTSAVVGLPGVNFGLNTVGSGVMQTTQQIIDAPVAVEQILRQKQLLRPGAGNVPFVGPPEGQNAQALAAITMGAAAAINARKIFTEKTNIETGWTQGGRGRRQEWTNITKNTIIDWPAAARAGIPLEPGTNKPFNSPPPGYTRVNLRPGGKFISPRKIERVDAPPMRSYIDPDDNKGGRRLVNPAPRFPALIPPSPVEGTPYDPFGGEGPDELIPPSPVQGTPTVYDPLGGEGPDELIPPSTPTYTNGGYSNYIDPKYIKSSTLGGEGPDELIPPSTPTYTNGGYSNYIDPKYIKSSTLEGIGPEAPGYVAPYTTPDPVYPYAINAAGVMIGSNGLPYTGSESPPTSYQQGSNPIPYDPYGTEPPTLEIQNIDGGDPLIILDPAYTSPREPFFGLNIDDSGILYQEGTTLEDIRNGTAQYY